MEVGEANAWLNGTGVELCQFWAGGKEMYFSISIQLILTCCAYTFKKWYRFVPNEINKKSIFEFKNLVISTLISHKMSHNICLYKKLWLEYVCIGVECCNVIPIRVNFISFQNTLWKIL